MRKSLNNKAAQERYFFTQSVLKSLTNSGATNKTFDRLNIRKNQLNANW